MTTNGHPLSIRIDQHKTSLRPGPTLTAQLDARGDSPTATIKRDLERYYRFITKRCPKLPIEQARALYDPEDSPRLNLIVGASLTLTENLCIVDALERADLIIQRTGCTVDDALQQVGLVANTAPDTAPDTAP
jgi:hypothetical protein